MRAVVVLLFLLCATSVEAQFTLVEQNCDNGNLFGGTDTYILNLPTNADNGNLIIVSSDATLGGTIISVDDSGTTVYTIQGSASVGSAGAATIWKGIAAGGTGGQTVTIVLSDSENGDVSVCVSEWSGANSDQSGATSNGSVNEDVTTHNSGSVTPPTAHNVVYVHMARTLAGTWTNDGAFTRFSTLAASENYWVGYLIQTAATAQEWNSSNTDMNYSVIRIAAFAGAGGGGSGGSFSNSSFSLTGVTR
jgi:hypothetical protein